MAVIQIKTCPSPVLRKKAKQVDNIDGSTVELANNMFETMYASSGIGLAAPQIGVSLTIFTVDVERNGNNRLVFINPKIINRSGESVQEEGCLSIPDIFADVSRAEMIELSGFDLDEKEITIKAEGILARAIQHEMDHLNGRLFWDRIGKVQRDILKKKYSKLKKD